MDQNKAQKLSGINLITSTLNRGSVGEQVKALQQYLNGLGYDVGKVDSVYGPKVEAAVRQFQLDNGLKGDGIFGPKSVGIARTLATTSTPAGNPGSGKTADDPSNMFNTETGELNPNFKPTTQKELDAYYNASALAHPVFKNNDPSILAYAAETGDFSSLVNEQGLPFSIPDQKQAVEEASKALAPGFEAEKSFDTQNIEENLAAKKREYEDFLKTEGENFAADKAELDQTAADRGVLFSGGRVEKEKKLQDLYSRNEALNRARTGDDISSLARTFQYNYGDKASKQPSISQYYQVGGNTYNANTARNNVGKNPLASIYNPGVSDFQGTKVNANKVAANVRAADLLKNKGNKLLASGYGNQF